MKYLGISASNGIAVGKIVIIQRPVAITKRVILAKHRELALFKSALILAKDELKHLMVGTEKEHYDILNFQLVMLDDVGMHEMVELRIACDKGASLSVEETMEEYCNRLKELENEYISLRSVDVGDALSRVVDILDGTIRTRLSLSEPSVVVADEITPSDLACMDREMVMGFITTKGSYHSHASIIARTMGIPSVCQVENEIINPLNYGKQVALDGYSGEVYLSPSSGTLTRFNHVINMEKRTIEEQKVLRNTPITTYDNQEVLLYANCSDPKDISVAVENGAKGIGLVRSEILFMSSNYNLTLNSQIDFYSNCIINAKGLPVTIRAFDIGMDKPLDGYSVHEQNPALGMRGIRLLKNHADIFKTQLEAFYIASDKYGKLKVMAPMVVNVSEFTDYLALAKEVKEHLTENGTITKDLISFGVMIETPAAALISDELARVADFFSIGTNDLTQYTLASDRLNDSVAHIFDYNHPAVTYLINMTVKNATFAGIEVSICGESASDLKMAKIYVDLGVRCLSMSSGAMLGVKQFLLEKLTTNFNVCK